MMPLSANDLEALHSEIQRVSSTQKMIIKPALHLMLDLLNPSLDVSPAELLRRYVANIQAASGIEKITARDATIPQLVEIFDLTYSSVEDQWRLAEDSLLKAPKILSRHLSDLRQAFYEDQSEATCRITIDIILIQCRKYIREKYHLTQAEPAFLTAPSTPTKDAFGLPAETKRKPTRIYPESTISVEVDSRSAPNKKFLVSGRADWVLGYSPKPEDGALLVALEAKRRLEFSSGESQLITYLAILSENRRKAGKTNTMTQGFYSDGSRFAFVYLTEDGTVKQSPTFDIGSEGGLDMVFSFIVAMLETALKSTPPATPTKTGKQQDKEIKDFKEEVWSKYYKLMDESLRVGNDSDDDMDNTIEVSEVF